MVMRVSDISDTHQLSDIGPINDALSMFSVGRGNVGRTMPDGRTQGNAISML